MIADELVEELRLIAYYDKAKCQARVSALASLARNGKDTKRVRETLYSIATDKHTPDTLKVRAIDLIDKLDISSAPHELTAEEAAVTEQSLMDQYVGTP